MGELEFCFLPSLFCTESMIAGNAASTALVTILMMVAFMTIPRIIRLLYLNTTP